MQPKRSDGAKNREQSIERWQLEAEVAEDALAETMRAATRYMESALRSVFLLNGGALIAFPAFARLSYGGFTDTGFLLATLLAFLTGLVCAAIGNLFALLAESHAADLLFAERGFIEGKRHVRSRSIGNKINNEEDEYNRPSICHNYSGKIRIKKRLAISAVVLSLFSFSTGAAFGAFSLFREGHLNALNTEMSDNHRK